MLQGKTGKGLFGIHNTGRACNSQVDVHKFESHQNQPWWEVSKALLYYPGNVLDHEKEMG